MWVCLFKHSRLHSFTHARIKIRCVCALRFCTFAKKNLLCIFVSDTSIRVNSNSLFLCCIKFKWDIFIANIAISCFFSLSLYYAAHKKRQGWTDKIYFFFHHFIVHRHANRFEMKFKFFFIIRLQSRFLFLSVMNLLSATHWCENRWMCK